MRHDPHIEATAGGEDDVRPIWRAMLRGWRRRCPRCGGGPMMDGYLKVRGNCAACGLPLSSHRADDMPAWLTIIVVGHILVPLLVAIEVNLAPPVWVHWAIWPALTVLLTLWFLPRLKGAIVSLQWAWKMHGFAPEGERASRETGSREEGPR